MHAAVRSFLAEPAVADPPARVWRDWALVAVIVVTAVPEAILRDDLPWPALALLSCVAIGVSLLWRRTHPLATTALAFTTASLLGVAGAIADTPSTPGLYSMAFVLVLPYALVRWASGRDVAIGAAIMLAGWAIGITVDPGTIGDAIGGFVVLLLPATLGGTVRYWSTARSREVDEAKHREREQLARELHDTVAHHVSAIVVQAQAGRAVAAARPETAVDVLATIEAEASRTLDEMRSMVGALRRDDAAQLAPQQGVADLSRLAAAAPSGMAVHVHVDGDASSLEAVVDAAAFRIAQEAVTNAVRHARNASAVDVEVTVSDDALRVTVVDDGDPVGDRGAGGYGLVGMTERATLLGGTLDAGPGPDGRWRVDADLPRNRVVR